MTTDRTLCDSTARFINWKLVNEGDQLERGILTAIVKPARKVLPDLYEIERIVSQRKSPERVTQSVLQRKLFFPEALHESQSKFIQERITALERNFGQLCDILSSYTRKTARLRDKGDLLAKELVAHVEKESLNPSTKKGISDFAAALSAVQDYRQAQVGRLEAKVVQPISEYGLVCKQAKTGLKTAFSAQEREQKSRRNLERVRKKNPSDRHQIAETSLQKASVDASKTSKLLEQEIDNFEKRKLDDLKKVMVNFVNIELHFHAKALELYTDCFQGLTNISVEEDLEEFRNYMHPPQSASRQGIVRTASQRSLNSTTNSSTPSDFYTHTSLSTGRRTLPQPQQRQQATLSDEDDDEYDDDDDDGDDSEDEITETPRSAPNTRVVQVK